MSTLLPSTTVTRPGFRLHRLEVYNWGTFDSASEGNRGEVYCIEPQGETTLLIGRNGSGKSTLVDAVLTLLVRPAVRNYNVAAGAKKRERDERTYIRGAFDRRSGDEDGGAMVRYLRPGTAHYSVLLACFHNRALKKDFTIAQVLYITADGQAERIYCFDDRARSIAKDCAGLNKSDMLQQLKKRGFRTTRNFREYHEWFRRATGVQKKAMDMLNQTVAVKDIQRLNEFIREHMLEARAWGATVDSLLTHFNQLSEAHQLLVRVRDQLKLLEPIEKYGLRWQEQTEQLQTAERLMAATEAFFRQKVVDVFAPECDARRSELVQVCSSRNELAAKIADVRGIIRRLENEIDNAGGDRLKEVPRLIELEQKDAANKRHNSKRFHDLLHAAGVQETVGDAESLQEILAELPVLKGQAAQQLADVRAKFEDAVIERGNLRTQLHEAQEELAALEKRQSSLPRRFVEVRQQLCDVLGLNPRDLPFAAELISVSPDEPQWEASIEMVLRSFALSLLVPDKHYRIVSGYMDQHRLQDSRGFGQKIVYLRVRERQQRLDGSVLDPDSLVRKLKLREGHILLPWVRSELEDRFDYRCCHDIQDFQSVHGPAITAERHVRNRDHHSKDDRDRVSDPAGFVLGWDNRDKKRLLAERIAQLQQDLSRIENTVSSLQQKEQLLHSRLAAIDVAHQVREFSDIDFMSHDAAIVRLQEERRQLEQDNDVVRVLKQKLAEHGIEEKRLALERDELGKREGALENQLQEAERILETARRTLDQLNSAGELAEYAESFSTLEERLGNVPLDVFSFDQREKQFRRTLEGERDRLRMKVQPVQERLLKEMSRFLAKFPEEKADLDPSTAYLDSFLGLLEAIREEDLPRHEQRFKERLNDKVTREIGLLNSELERERYAIEDKIDLLNQALMQLEYRPGTHMRLEVRLVSDREIRDFRNEIHSCLEDAIAESSEADEARFVRIEKLIHRLRDEDRWRNKVIDVRRWFDFAAREIDEATGEERSYYEDSTGQSGGEKAKLAFTILVAAIAYQYDIEPGDDDSERFHFVVVDEMFSKIDDQYSEYALELFRKFGLQLLIVAPLDAKARVTERHVGCYLLVTKDEQSHSRIHSMTAREFEEQTTIGEPDSRPLKPRKPR
ncbi:MAG: SbcC/MukB-like Walker B domain-containing protein [Fuerstiella sp.]